MPKVFILNNTSYDFSPAEEFGELKINSTESFPIFNTGLTLSMVKSFLEDYTEEDFIVMSGSPVVSALAFCTIFSKFDKIHILLFDAKGRKYVPRTFSKLQVGLV